MDLSKFEKRFEERFVDEYTNASGLFCIQRLFVAFLERCLREINLNQRVWDCCVVDVKKLRATQGVKNNVAAYCDVENFEDIVILQYEDTQHSEIPLLHTLLDDTFRSWNLCCFLVYCAKVEQFLFYGVDIKARKLLHFKDGHIIVDDECDLTMYGEHWTYAIYERKKESCNDANECITTDFVSNPIGNLNTASSQIRDTAFDVLFSDDFVEDNDQFDSGRLSDHFIDEDAPNHATHLSDDESNKSMEDWEDQRTEETDDSQNPEETKDDMIESNTIPLSNSQGHIPTWMIRRGFNSGPPDLENNTIVTPNTAAPTTRTIKWKIRKKDVEMDCSSLANLSVPNCKIKIKKSVLKPRDALGVPYMREFAWYIVHIPMAFQTNLKCGAYAMLAGSIFNEFQRFLKNFAQAIVAQLTQQESIDSIPAIRQLEDELVEFLEAMNDDQEFAAQLDAMKIQLCRHENISLDNPTAATNRRVNQLIENMNSDQLRYLSHNHFRFGNISPIDHIDQITANITDLTVLQEGLTGIGAVWHTGHCTGPVVMNTDYDGEHWIANDHFFVNQCFVSFDADSMGLMYSVDKTYELYEQLLPVTLIASALQDFPNVCANDQTDLRELNVVFIFSLIRQQLDFCDDSCVTYTQQLADSMNLLIQNKDKWITKSQEAGLAVDENDVIRARRRIIERMINQNVLKRSATNDYVDQTVRDNNKFHSLFDADRELIRFVLQV